MSTSVNYEEVRRLARGFLGNMKGWRTVVLTRVHKRVLDDPRAVGGPDIMACLKEVLGVIAEATNETEARDKLAQLTGSRFTKELGSWLGHHFAHFVYAEAAFRRHREDGNACLYLVLIEAHGHFKRRVGEELLAELLLRAGRKPHAINCAESLKQKPEKTDEKAP